MTQITTNTPRLSPQMRESETVKCYMLCIPTESNTAEIVTSLTYSLIFTAQQQAL